MKYFSILGERCSGTIFTEHAISRNFKLEYRDLKTKHTFGHTESIFNIEDIDDILFIFVVRNPVDWIDSFFKRLHHVPPENKESIHSFINNEFYSIHELGSLINTEIMEDRNINTGERYKNIFELRKVKNEYLLNVFKNRVKNFAMLRYEDLRDNYENTLDKLKDEFCLEKTNIEYETIIRYKGTYTALYFKKPILLPNEVIEEIKSRVDVDQEKELGYEFV
jgi:hypothetical protein